MSVRVEPDVYEGFQAWAERQTTRDGALLSEAECVRRLFRWALEQVGTVKELDDVSQGYEEGLRRGQANWNKAAYSAWLKVKGED